MKRKLASVQKVVSVDPIVFKDNNGMEQTAENIERIQVLGWTLVAQKGEFRLGDQCVFVEPDAVLPERPEFEFLRKCCYIDKNGFRGFLIGTSRRLGIISQGIALHISVLGDGNYEIGEDVSNVLGIVKYDPPVPACISGLAKGNFPSFVLGTDELRVHGIP
ncbi:MAG: RNA ligase (ATP), partial [Candidatus Gracilibacteria bacterium]|nr:RNA ligase (ATP) [Candidatus Gracilibacteria bacterium]